MGGTVEEYESAKEAVRIYGQSLEELDGQYNELNGKLTEHKQKMEEVNTASSSVPGAMKETTESARELETVLSELDDAYEENMQKAIASLEAQRDKFAELKNVSAGNVKDIKSEMEDQAEGIKRYAEDVAEAQKIMEVQPGAEGLLNYYINQGPAAVSELEALLNAFKGTEEQVKSFEEACASFNASEELIEGLGKLDLAISTGSSEAIQLAIEALDVELPELEARFQESWDLQTEAIEQYKDDMTSTMEGTITDMAGAVDDNSGKVTTASTTMLEKMLKAVHEALGYDEETGRCAVYYQLGMQVDQSIADGMIDNQDLVAGALQGVFDNAIGSLDLSSLSSAINTKLGEALRK